jgi:predicted TIM-barrel fold metal-dependent hydrolase
MKIFDCHANLGWDMSNTRKNMFPTNHSTFQLLNKMEHYEVNAAIIVPFPSPGGQFNENATWYEVENQTLMNAMRSYPKLMAFAGVNPADFESVNNINTLAIAYNIQGIKFSHQIPMNFNIDDLIGHPLMDIVKRHTLVVMIHVGTGKERGANHVHTTLPYAIQVAKHYPHIKFIFCHLGRLHKDLFIALDMPNVWMDTAGFSLGYRWSAFVAKESVAIFKNLTPEDIIKHLVSQGYEDKLLFGSDEPYTRYDKELGIIQKAHIPIESMEKILGKNLAGLLGLHKW